MRCVLSEGLQIWVTWHCSGTFAVTILEIIGDKVTFLINFVPAYADRVFVRELRKWQYDFENGRVTYR